MALLLRTLSRPAVVSARMVVRTPGSMLAARTSTTATAAPAEVDKYSKTLRWFHLAMGAGVLTCFATVNASQQSKDKKFKGKMMNLHKSVALLLAGGVVGRIAVRLASTVPPHLPGPKPLQFAASAGHLALYGFMIVMPGTGIAMGYFGGKGLPFFGYTIPGAENKRGDIAKQAYQIHKQAGLAFEGMVLAHFGGSMFHFAKGQAVFARMNPFI